MPANKTAYPVYIIAAVWPLCMCMSECVCVCVLQLNFFWVYVGSVAFFMCASFSRTHFFSYISHSREQFFRSVVHTAWTGNQRNLYLVNNGKSYWLQNANMCTTQINYPKHSHCIPCDAQTNTHTHSFDAFTSAYTRTYRHVVCWMSECNRFIFA